MTDIERRLRGPNPKLLLLGCSRRKSPAPEMLPAIERYDGPVFRLVRVYLRSCTTGDLSVRILSAEHGLLHPDTLIGSYDRAMTAARAAALRDDTAAQAWAWGNSFMSCPGGHGSEQAEAMLVMGRPYLHALGDLSEIFPQGTDVRVADGPPGSRLARLHNWLYRSTDAEVPGVLRADVRRTAVLRGVEVTSTLEEILDIARRCAAPARHFGWHVDVKAEPTADAGHKTDAVVGAKELVSLLTGLPRGAFHTEEAVRLLRRLGVPVSRRDRDRAGRTVGGSSARGGA